MRDFIPSPLGLLESILTVLHVLRLVHCFLLPKTSKGGGERCPPSKPRPVVAVAFSKSPL